MIPNKCCNICTLCCDQNGVKTGTVTPYERQQELKLAFLSHTYKVRVLKLGLGFSFRQYFRWKVGSGSLWNFFKFIGTRLWRYMVAAVGCLTSGWVHWGKLDFCAARGQIPPPTQKDMGQMNQPRVNSHPYGRKRKVSTQSTRSANPCCICYAFT